MHLICYKNKVELEKYNKKRKHYVSQFTYHRICLDIKIISCRKKEKKKENLGWIMFGTFFLRMLFNLFNEILSSLKMLTIKNSRENIVEGILAILI